MIDVLQEYVRDTDEAELLDLIELGYQEIYSDVSLSVIYEELSICFNNDEMEQRIEHMFGYYGPGVLLHVAGTYYWLMQA